jgi:hypothetical protein
MVLPMQGVQTRLLLSPEQEGLLGDLIQDFQTQARQAYQHICTGKLALNDLAQSLRQGSLTSHQQKSLVSQVEQWLSNDRATLSYRIEQNTLRIVALEDAVKGVDEKLCNLDTQMRAGCGLRPAAENWQGFNRHASRNTASCAMLVSSWIT